MADIADKQIKRLRSLIDEAETSLACAKELLISLVGDDTSVSAAPKEELTGGKVIEGVFDGQNMLGPDGKTYPVPANYASKSKLVQGDVMKLSINQDGSFTYKQIGPVPRKTVLGTLKQADGQYLVEVNGKDYHILLASVTYFKVQAGDQVSVVLPEDDTTASWAALEAAI